MSKFAPAQYPTPGPGEITGSQLSEQDLDKLQEIHELINLLMRELPLMAQITAQSYVTPSLPAVPYTYSLFQIPWQGIAFVPRQGV
jgi:hypothetical protein